MKNTSYEAANSLSTGARYNLFNCIQFLPYIISSFIDLGSTSQLNDGLHLMIDTNALLQSGK